MSRNFFLDENNTVNISLNNNENNECDIGTIGSKNEENDNNDNCDLKINRKCNKIKTPKINNNIEKSNENFIEEKAKKLDSYFLKTTNVETASILDKNYVNDDNENLINDKNIIDETLVNYKNEDKSEDPNMTLDNLSCCSENFLITANINNEKNSSINMSDDDNNNEEDNDNFNDNCNINDTKPKTALSPLLTAIFLNTNKNCDNNTNVDNNISKIQQMFEAQNKLYSTLIFEQQRKNMSVMAAAKAFPLLNTNSEKNKLSEKTLLPQTQLQQLQNLAKNEAKLDLFNKFAGVTIDKTQNKKVIFIYFLI